MLEAVKTIINLLSFKSGLSTFNITFSIFLIKKSKKHLKLVSSFNTFNIKAYTRRTVKTNFKKCLVFTCQFKIKT